MARKQDEAPDWIRKKDYGYLCGLDAAGWLRELDRCAFLDNEVKKRAAGEPTFEEEWKGVLDDEIAAGFVPCLIGPPVVEIVVEDDLESLGALKRHTLTVRMCLAANDADIMAAIKKILLRAREQYASPIIKPGPRALNARIGKFEFKRWQSHKVVEISELLDWASREGRKVQNADLGRWLFARHKDPDKAACKALEMRQRAFALIPALWAQVNQTLPITGSKQRQGAAA